MADTTMHLGFRPGCCPGLHLLLEGAWRDPARKCRGKAWLCREKAGNMGLHQTRGPNNAQPYRPERSVPETIVSRIFMCALSHDFKRCRTMARRLSLPLTLFMEVGFSDLWA